MIKMLVCWRVILLSSLSFYILSIIYILLVFHFGASLLEESKRVYMSSMSSSEHRYSDSSGKTEVDKSVLKSQQSRNSSPYRGISEAISQVFIKFGMDDRRCSGQTLRIITTSMEAGFTKTLERKVYMVHQNCYRRGETALILHRTVRMNQDGYILDNKDIQPYQASCLNLKPCPPNYYCNRQYRCLVCTSVNHKCLNDNECCTGHVCQRGTCRPSRESFNGVEGDFCNRLIPCGKYQTCYFSDLDTKKLSGACVENTFIPVR